MPASAVLKQETLKKFQRHPKDTASPEVQVALLTYRLEYLKDHFAQHGSDHHSKTGLLKMVGRRRKLLDYLKKRNYSGYRTLITELGIRK